MRARLAARPTKPGVSGVHTHMTNSLNTPVEALEYAYPFRVTEYSLRRGSGGDGTHKGGDGVVREIEVLTDAEVTLLADRRKTAPYGLSGGDAGKCGRSIVIRENGAQEELPGKTSVRLRTASGCGLNHRAAGDGEKLSFTAEDAEDRRRLLISDQSDGSG